MGSPFVQVPHGPAAKERGEIGTAEPNRSPGRNLGTKGRFFVPQLRQRPAFGVKGNGRIPAERIVRPSKTLAARCVSPIGLGGVGAVSARRRVLTTMCEDRPQNLPTTLYGHLDDRGPPPIRFFREH